MTKNTFIYIDKYRNDKLVMETISSEDFLCCYSEHFLYNLNGANSELFCFELIFCNIEIPDFSGRWLM